MATTWQQIANVATSTLAAGISDVATVLTVATGDGALFPATAGGTFLFVLRKADYSALEICQCTTRATDEFSVIVRAQESTVAVAWDAGDYVELVLTAGHLTAIRTAVNAIENTYCASTATDNAVARFDGTGGKTLQNSGVVVDDSNNVTGVNSLQVGGGYGSTGVTISEAGAIQADGKITAAGGVAVSKLFNLASTNLDIASDAITITGSHHALDTEGDAATDNLSTINGAAAAGDLLILRTQNSARDVVVKHGTGNIQCGADFTLSNVHDTIMLMWNSAAWVCIAKSDNA